MIILLYLHRALCDCTHLRYETTVKKIKDLPIKGGLYVLLIQLYSNLRLQNIMVNIALSIQLADQFDSDLSAVSRRNNRVYAYTCDRSGHPNSRFASTTKAVCLNNGFDSRLSAVN
ncbi:hypothetical protein D3C80_1379780 [compost metagenome]